ncbi:IS1182 family transposase [Verrucomicrobium sp. 3C]|uniref:IS1182 family transposase n=1 Tax=Verrucomicrobium sp. 3C TaxID=1134055 RepID=UPI00037F8019|nr:IS1182 family transposase [Verrucomicrobium sp. 3C]
MAERLLRADRMTPMLLPEELRDWVAEDDLVYFVIETVERMDLREFRINVRGTEDVQYPSSMMLSLLIYCYANGIFSSRRNEAATWRDVAVRYLCANTHPDHDTICRFRRENFAAVADCFLKVLELAREMKLLKVGVVSVDGTKIRANASKHRNVTYERAGELVELLRADVTDLLKKAEEADRRGEADPGKLPEEIGRRQRLQEKLEEAQRRLEERAKERAERERADYERKVEEREARKGSAKGRHIQPPEEKPGAEEHSNLTDSESRLMRKSRNEAFEQSYNAQAAVDADGSALVLSARVSVCANDTGELEADVRAIPTEAGRVRAVLVDTGYANGEQVEALQAEGIEVYCPMRAEALECRRRYEFRPTDRRREKPVAYTAPWRRKMIEKLASPESRRLYARRKQTVEPVFGIIKSVMGFRAFRLRGQAKVQGEWSLACLAYNSKRLWSLWEDAEPGQAKEGLPDLLASPRSPRSSTRWLQSRAPRFPASAENFSPSREGRSSSIAVFSH